MYDPLVTDDRDGETTVFHESLRMAKLTMLLAGGGSGSGPPPSGDNIPSSWQTSPSLVAASSPFTW